MGAGGERPPFVVSGNRFGNRIQSNRTLRPSRHVPTPPGSEDGGSIASVGFGFDADLGKKD